MFNIIPAAHKTTKNKMKQNGKLEIHSWDSWQTMEPSTNNLGEGSNTKKNMQAFKWKNL